MQFSFGYFSYDFFAMAYLGILDRSMTIHHLLCMGGLSGALVTGKSGDILVATIFLTEISNPAMHVRVILRLLGLRYTQAYETTEISYMGKLSSFIQSC